MTDKHELERQLRQLGADWPSDPAFVDGVMSRLDSPAPMAARTQRSRLMRFSVWTAAALLISFGLFRFASDDSGSALYAQVKEALSHVRTIHSTVEGRGPDGEWHTAQETWFARGRGFAVISDTQVRIDNGTWFWEYIPGTGTASRGRSLGTDELLDKALDIRTELERDCERYPDGDRSIDGVAQQCYLLTFKGPVKPADPSVLDLEKQRTLIFISPKFLVKRVETQDRVDDEWVPRLVRSWEYDVAVDDGVFEPDFGENVKVIDFDKAFEQLVGTSSAVHVEEREGLIYAIHRLERFENGGILLMTSVRGTDETLRTHPPTRRMIQPGLYLMDGPATNYDASPQGGGAFRITLAFASHQGVDVQWWVKVPRGRKPDWFEDQDGKCQIQLGVTPRGSYAEQHKDERGVVHHIYWDVALDVAEPESLPTLEQAAAKVHADLTLLKAVPRQSLDMGVKTVNGQDTGQRASVEDVGAEQFARAVREHVQWWERNDVEFQSTSGGRINFVDGQQVTTPGVFVSHYSVVDDAAVARMTERPDLVEIAMNGTNITDAGLQYLQGLEQLQELSIAETAITDAGLEHLSGLSSLRKLDITSTRTTAAGIEKLRKALPQVEIVSDAD